MELCKTCKKKKCNKNVVIMEQNNLKTIKCLEYEKDKNKTKGYKKPLERTAKQQKTVQARV